MKRVWMLLPLLCLLILSAAPALAQTTQAADPLAGLNPQSITPMLTTISGVAILTVFVTAPITTLLGKYKIGILSDLPTPVIVVAVGFILTALANLVFHTLEGNIVDLLWQSMFASGGASALFSWWKNGLGSPATKADEAKVSLPMNTKSAWVAVLILPLAMAMGGCSGMSSGQKYIVASNTYETTMKVLTDLRTAGYLTTADRRVISQLSNKADVLLDEMYQDVLNRNPMGVEYLLDKFDSIMDDLLLIQIQAEKVKAESTKKKETPNVPVSTRNHPGDQGGGRLAGFPLEDVGRDSADRARTDQGGTCGSDGGPQGGEGGLGRWRDGDGDGAVRWDRPGDALVGVPAEVEWD